MFVPNQRVQLRYQPVEMIGIAAVGFCHRRHAELGHILREVATQRISSNRSWIATSSSLLGALMVAWTGHVGNIRSDGFDRIHVLITNTSIVRVHVIRHVTYEYPISVSPDVYRRGETDRHAESYQSDPFAFPLGDVAWSRRCLCPCHRRQLLERRTSSHCASPRTKTEATSRTDHYHSGKLHGKEYGRWRIDRALFLQ